MLGLFSSSVVSPPEDLVAAGGRTPSPKTTASALLKQFLKLNNSGVSVQIGDHVHLAYSHHNQSPLHPRSFGVKDEIFCLFEGVVHNLGSLRQDYGLAKSANEEVLVIEAYKALRDRAPYPPSRVVGHLLGDFAFVLFDHSTSTLFVASYMVDLNKYSNRHAYAWLAIVYVLLTYQHILGNLVCVTRDQQGKVALYWGITADGFVAFADDADLLKGACGKSLASFPQGCFFSTAVGKLQSYENPKNKITAVPAAEEEIWGATFKVEGPAVLAATD